MKKIYFLLLFLATFSMSAQTDLVLNEYMPYPSSTSISDPNELDSNKNGSLGGTSDEYIELVNSGASALDISGWKLNDGSDRHIFPASTVVPAGGAIVVFGGGTGLSSSDFGNSIVQAASSGGLGLSNSGDTFEVLNASDVQQITETYASTTPGIAYARNPDTSGSIGTHPANATLLADGGGSAFASPGTKIDGSLFIAVTVTEVQFSSASGSVDESGGTYDLTVSIVGEDATNATTVEVALTTGSAADINNYTTQTATFPAGSSADQIVTLTITDDAVAEGGEDLIFTLQNVAGGNSAAIGTNTTHTLTIVDNEVSPTDLVVNEYMPWPAGANSSAGSDTRFDANGDGAYSFDSDEYVELVNSGGSSLDISGWKINDGIDRHIFPASTVIPAGGAILVFGGGTPTGSFGGSIVQTASESTSLGMTNSGDALTIKDNTDLIRIEFSYGAATRAVAFARNPDITGSFAAHPTNTSGPKNEDLTDAKASPGTTLNGGVLSTKSFEALGLKMYPNPVKDGLVYIKSKTLGEKNIELFDVNGRSILKTKLKADALDVSAVKSGFYLLKISTGARSATSKLIIK